MVKNSAREVVFKLFSETGAIRLASQEHDDALHRQLVATADQDVIPLSATSQFRATARHQLHMNHPRLATTNPKDFVRLGSDG